MKKPSGYWTIELAIEESKKYNTLAELKKKNQYVAVFLKKNGVLDQCTWLKRGFIYNDENCTEIALNYKTETEFNNEKPRAYQYARQHGLLEKFHWMKRTVGTASNPLWTRDRLKEEIKKYKYRNDFGKHCRGGYAAISRNGWWDLLDVYPKFPDGNVYTVYVYDFPDFNTTYVGLTKRKNDITGENGRDDDHHGQGKYCNSPNKSPVYRFAEKYGITDYKPIYTIDGLTAEEAKNTEESEIEKYKAMGRIMLNRAKAGSLGQNGVKWTKEKVIELAKNFVLPGDFYKAYPGAYYAAHGNGWIDEFEWMEHNRWSKWLVYENCYNEAKKYSSRTEFSNMSSGAYHMAREKKWLDSFTWLKRPKRESKYNYDICKKMCLECRNRKEMEEKHNGCIQWLRKFHSDWLDEFLPKSR